MLGERGTISMGYQSELLNPANLFMTVLISLLVTAGPIGIILLGLRYLRRLRHDVDALSEPVDRKS